MHGPNPISPTAQMLPDRPMQALFVHGMGRSSSRDGRLPTSQRVAVVILERMARIQPQRTSPSVG